MVLWIRSTSKCVNLVTLSPFKSDIGYLGRNNRNTIFVRFCHSTRFVHLTYSIFFLVKSQYYFFFVCSVGIFELPNLSTVSKLSNKVAGASF
jgi:hypothetical protein